MHSLRLEQRWTPEAASEHGAFHFRLHNLGTTPVAINRLCYASMTRLAADVRVTGGTFGRKFAGHVEIDAAEGHSIAPGGIWEITLDGLTHKPDNRTQGAMAAWIETPDGALVEAEVGDLLPPRGTARTPAKLWPEGAAPDPLGLLPAPQEARIESFGPARRLAPGEGLAPAALAEIAALHRRLFPDDPAVATLDIGPESLVVRAALDDSLPAEGYRLAFDAEGVTLTFADPAGQRHALIALAQMTHFAQVDPRYAQPTAGEVSDAPRFGWRGAHLDVARNFVPADEVARLIDILAWSRMNRLHLHLTDDEGWRLDSAAFPALTQEGATRHAHAALKPQYADGPVGQRGSYTQTEMRALVAHATTLGVEVMPEMDMPGHVTALLTTIDGLRDPEEPEAYYRSVQGYPNNGLNPALERSYEVVGTLLREWAEIFPGEVIHIGGDEVDAGAWARSPAACALAKQLGIAPGAGAPPLQAHFMNRVHGMLRDMARVVAGWDECADGGGIAPEGTVLFAWRNVEKTAELLAAGYDVVATPGQAYYLDMVQGAGWDTAGTSWAGPVPVETTYEFEVSEGLPADAPGRLLGVQACCWGEHYATRSRRNEMIFPRLYAVAEAAWCRPERKDFLRFCALSRGMPDL